MAIPEWQKQVPIVDNITLETSLDDIPEGPPCMACGYPTEKIYLDEHTCGGTSGIVRAENVAGYRCRNGCGFESYSHEAILESLVKAREIMLARGDKATAKAFGTAIALREKIIAEDRLAMPYLYADDHIS